MQTFTNSDRLLRKFICSIMPCDYLQLITRTRSYRGYYVVNTKSLKDSPVIKGHWIVLLLRHGNFRLFDPLGFSGRQLYNECLKRFIRKNVSVWNYEQFQPLDSMQCGYYCLLFMYMDCRGYSNDMIKNTLTEITDIVPICNQLFCMN